MFHNHAIKKFLLIKKNFYHSTLNKQSWILKVEDLYQLVEGHTFIEDTVPLW